LALVQYYEDQNLANKGQHAKQKKTETQMKFSENKTIPQLFTTTGCSEEMVENKKRREDVCALWMTPSPPSQRSAIGYLKKLKLCSSIQKIIN
jgi:hypothetical protein